MRVGEYVLFHDLAPVHPVKLIEWYVIIKIIYRCRASACTRWGWIVLLILSRLIRGLLLARLLLTLRLPANQINVLHVQSDCRAVRAVLLLVLTKVYFAFNNYLSAFGQILHKTAFRPLSKQSAIKPERLLLLAITNANGCWKVAHGYAVRGVAGFCVTANAGQSNKF